MIVEYSFDYDMMEAEVFLKVDTEKFKPEDAKVLLEFFTWEYDKEADPVEELLKKYALQVIKIASLENFNEYGVKTWFEENEGFPALDGSVGIELFYVSQYTFAEERLFFTKQTIKR